MKPRQSLASTVVVVLLTVSGLRAAPRIVLEEGFEGGRVPPQGWEVRSLDADHTWELLDDGSARTGQFGAMVPRGPVPLHPQDEWLISPQLTLTTGTLSLWSRGSLTWCRDTNDNCDLVVWLVVGEVGGLDDVFLGKADDDWTASWAWSETVIDLTPSLPISGEPVRIAFEYLAFDEREDVALDDIMISGVGSELTIFADGFESGDTSAWSGSIP